MKRVVVYLLLLLLACSCYKEELVSLATDKSLPPVPRMNKFTEDKMKSVYLWAAEVQDRYPSRDLNPSVFFNQMVYEAEDKAGQWSHIDNNNSGPTAGVDGYENGFGYWLQGYSYSGYYFYQICYVYPNSPAARAGLKRGDVILENNRMPVFGVNELENSEGLSLTVGHVNSEGDIVPHKEVYCLTAEYIKTSPIIKDTVLYVGGKVVGYLHYCEFANDNKKSLQDLSSVFSRFKEAKVEEFILDLRYNPGGYVSSARHVCSYLAPRSSVEKSALLITKYWNEKMQRKLKDEPSFLEEHFDNSRDILDNNLNLKRLFTITGRYTASASELTISGLRSYMPVIITGERTHGKYVGSVTYVPDDDELKSWALHPIVFSYLNADGESVKEGMEPNFLIKESPLDMKPLGDPEEPLLKRVLGLISGTRYVEPESRGRSLFTPLPSIEKEKRMVLLSDAPPE